VLLPRLVDLEKGGPTLAANFRQFRPANQFAGQKWVIANGLCSRKDRLNPFLIDARDLHASIRARYIDQATETTPR
jgi:hypothetical protein